METGAARLLTAPRSLRALACLGLLTGGLAAPGSAAAADPLIAAAGDIACSPSSSSYNDGDGTSTRCRQRHTSDLVVQSGAAAVLALGDLQYHTARLSSFRESYGPSWGRLKAITRPAAGNHEYKTAGAAGYFDYFNGAGAFTGPAGDRDKGYYSFDVGAWHLIALNSSDHCTIVACTSGSAQARWLRADLAAHPTSCALAYWHHPRFNSGHDGNATFIQPLFEELYAAGVDVVLGGHAHSYERFALQDPKGKLDPTRGIRQFVVGTGGSFFTSMGTAKPNSQVRQANGYGVLFMTLHPTSYDWRFVSASAGGRVTDSGTQACNGLLPPAPELPAQPDDAHGTRSAAPSGTAPATPPAVACDVLGTPGDDVLVGSPLGETICGLGGDDRIRAGGGNDLVLGGPGDDRLHGGPGDDVIYGEAGHDTMRGNDGRDQVRGGRGRDTAYGGTGNDDVQGNFGNDTLRGHSGDDRVTGGGGADRLFGNSGNDLLIADGDRRGVDRVDGGRGRDVARVDPRDRVRRARRR